MITLADFDAQFSKHLGNTRRWEPFRNIAADLIARGRPVNIVETGCARQPDNWAGDGQSTLVWDWLLDNLGGTGLSMDINEANCHAAAAQVKHVKIACVDSVVGLRVIVQPETIDFLYLDSYDLTETIDSPTHHLAELTSVYPRLPSGCIIAVDDCVTEQYGKHRFVRDFLARMGVEPVLRGYVTVWVKP
jgi:cephalosporin hydroxylase